MSTLAYASITNVRDESDPASSRTATKPGVNTYVDAMAALVPAEVLGLHAILLSFTTETVNNEETGAVSTVISEPETLSFSFWGLVAFSVLLYVLGRGKSHLNKLDRLRFLIPPFAFVSWTMLQKSTAFDAVAPSLASAPRTAIALFVAAVIGAMAAWFAKKASASPV